jgi:alpha-L-arabinofuranosidase
MYFGPITVAARWKAWTIFAPSNTVILMHGCLCAFILFFVLSSVQVAALRLADPLSKEFYRLCIGSRNWTNGQGSLHKQLDCSGQRGQMHVLGWLEQRTENMWSHKIQDNFRSAIDQWKTWVQDVIKAEADHIYYRLRRRMRSNYKYNPHF